LIYFIRKCFFSSIRLYNSIDFYFNSSNGKTAIDNIFILYASIPCWPRFIDLDITKTCRGPDHIYRVHVDSTIDDDDEWVAYTGALGESFRSIVTNNCFPYFSSSQGCCYDDSSTDKYFSVCPFTRVICSPRTSSSKKGLPDIGHISLSCVAYFEATIHPSINLERVLHAHRDNTMSPQVFCIGLSCPPFSLRGRLPGFDTFSLGYISDGGLFYQGGIGQEFGASSYGPGDTVGCGIIYPSPSTSGVGKIFFTRNGVIQGIPLNVLNSSFFQISWFPTMGLDSHYPVRMNFGQKPFVFDVLSFEKNLYHEQVLYPNPCVCSSGCTTCAHRIGHRIPLSYPAAVIAKSLLNGGHPAHTNSSFSCVFFFHRTLRIINSELYKSQVYVRMILNIICWCN